MKIWHLLKLTELYCMITTLFSPLVDVLDMVVLAPTLQSPIKIANSNIFDFVTPFQTINPMIYLDFKLKIAQNNDFQIRLVCLPKTVRCYFPGRNISSEIVDLHSDRYFPRTDKTLLKHSYDNSVLLSSEQTKPLVCYRFVRIQHTKQVSKDSG